MTEIRVKKKRTDVGRREWGGEKKQKRVARGSSSVRKLSFLLVLVPLPPPACPPLQAAVLNCYQRQKALRSPTGGRGLRAPQVTCLCLIEHSTPRRRRGRTWRSVPWRLPDPEPRTSTAANYRLYGESNLTEFTSSFVQVKLRLRILGHNVLKPAEKSTDVSEEQYPEYSGLKKKSGSKMNCILGIIIWPWTRRQHVPPKRVFDFSTEFNALCCSYSQLRAPRVLPWSPVTVEEQFWLPVSETAEILALEVDDEYMKF
jgi:hypothetical protein